MGVNFGGGSGVEQAAYWGFADVGRRQCCLLVCVIKLLAALVLFEVSAASVVVALKVVPAEAKSEEKTIKKATDIRVYAHIPPDMRRPGKTTDSLTSKELLAFCCSDLKDSKSQFALSQIRESSKLLPIIYLSELRRMPEQCRLGN